MQFNFLLVMVVAAFVPLLLGFVWYHPKVFGTAWLKAGGFDAAKMKEGFNMPLVFGLTFFMGFLMAFALSGVVIHQMGFFSMINNHWKDPSTHQATVDFFNQTLQTYGGEFRTFKHGALHGAITGIGIALPAVAVCGMFERKSFKHIAINAGFWIACLIIMGGIICQFADLSSLA